MATRVKWLHSGAAALLLAVSIIPYAFVLRLLPTSRDGTIWLLEGSVHSPGWGNWVFLSKHFVGYRPLAALSYVICSGLGGDSVLAQRTADLGVHVACGITIVVLYGRLFPGLPRWGGLVALGVFAWHPLVGEVVPYLARRSNGLATLFSLLTILCLILPVDRKVDSELDGSGGGRPKGLSVLRALLAAALLLMALTSNEVAYAYLPLALWVGFRAGRPGEKGGEGGSGGLARLAPVLALLCATTIALVARGLVLGELGGYASGSGGASPQQIIRKSMEAVALVRPLDSEDAAPLLAEILGVASLLYYTWWGLWVPWKEGRRSVRWAFGGLWISLVSHLVLLAPFGVWFPRQLHGMTASLALLLAGLLADTVLRTRGKGLVRPLHLGIQLSVIGWLLAGSPVFDALRDESQALHAGRKKAWRAHDALLRDLQVETSKLPSGARVSLVIPYFTREGVSAHRLVETRGRPPLSARQPETWVSSLRGRELRVDTLAVFEIAPDAGAPGARVLHGPREFSLQFAAGIHPYILSAEIQNHSDSAGNSVLRLGRGRGKKDVHYLYFHDGVAGQLVPID